MSHKRAAAAAVLAVLTLAVQAAPAAGQAAPLPGQTEPVAGQAAPLPGQEAPAAGQAGRTPEGGASPWFPAATSFAPLLAQPREVGLRGSLVLADRDAPPGADFEGRNLEAEVALGHRVPVLRLQEQGDRRPELTLGFEVGVFSRFHLETPQKDLTNADFRVGVPLSGRYGSWEGRLTILHVSSHVGDDFDARFDVPFRQVTRDGVEATLARRLPGGLRIYGGVDLNFHVNPGVERTAARLGAEWDPGPADAGAPGGAGTAQDAPRDGGAARGARVATWPFAAADLEVTGRGDGAAAAAAAGLGIRVSGVVLRLELRGHVGPSTMGQFRGIDESFVGLGLRVEP